jgi:hypothetical protein
MKLGAGPTSFAFQQTVQVVHWDELGLASTFVAPRPNYAPAPEHH